MNVVFDADMLRKENQVKGYSIGHAEKEDVRISLEYNGDGEDVWAEIVVYHHSKELNEWVDDEFSDCLYEYPKTQQEMLDLLQPYIEEYIAS